MLAAVLSVPDAGLHAAVLSVQLEELFELMANGKLNLEVAHLFPLEKAPDAHRQVETGRTRGKVVLQVA